MKPGNCAIIAITKHGVSIGETLGRNLEGTIYTLKKFADRFAGQEPEILPQPFSKELGSLWKRHDCLIFIISVGAVVRMIAPLLENKKTDPAVICIDDKAQFAISLLSGHVGQANDYTSEVARVLSATPVITTASDVQDTLRVDILGTHLGWQLYDDHHNVTRLCAAVVNEEPVHVIQETGETNFWPEKKSWPKGVSYRDSIIKAQETGHNFILISDRQIQRLQPALYQQAIQWVPKSLCIGIGCDKNTPVDTLLEGIALVLEEFGLCKQAIASVSSLDIKTRELGVIACAKELGAELISYSAKELDGTPGVKNPSATVKKFVGCDSVAEAAALRAAEVRDLLIEKQKHYCEQSGKNMTIAICRKAYARRPKI